MQLYSRSEFSQMNETTYTQLYLLVSESAKTVMVRYFADTQSGVCTDSKPFRAQLTTDGIRWGGKRHGQSAQSISLDAASSMMRRR